MDLEKPICGDEDVCKETLPRGDCSGVCTFGDRAIGTDACIGGDARGERTFTGECVPLGERVPPGESTRGGEYVRGEPSVAGDRSPVGDAIDGNGIPGLADVLTAGVPTPCSGSLLKSLGTADGNNEEPGLNGVLSCHCFLKLDLPVAGVSVVGGARSAGGAAGVEGSGVVMGSTRAVSLPTAIDTLFTPPSSFSIST